MAPSSPPRRLLSALQAGGCRQIIVFTCSGGPARDTSIYGRDTVFLLHKGEVKLGKLSRDQLMEPRRIQKDEKGILGRGNSKGLEEGMHLSCPGRGWAPRERPGQGLKCLLEGGGSSREERLWGCSWTDTWKG